MLLNGLTNASKYSSRGGGGGRHSADAGIRVLVSTDSTTGAMVLEVLDDGAGLHGQTFEQLTTDFGGTEPRVTPDSRRARAARACRR